MHPMGGGAAYFLQDLGIGVRVPGHHHHMGHAQELGQGMLQLGQAKHGAA